MPIVIDPHALYSDLEYRGLFIPPKKPSTTATERSRGDGPRFIKMGKTILYRGSDILAHMEIRSAQHGAEAKERRRGAA